MSFVQGLHGTFAAVLLLVLLFVDEAGIPLPIAPNEGVLLLIGVLIASGEFPLWIIAPAAFLVMTAGMVAGYSWARTIGAGGLVAIAERLHASEVYARAQARLRSATPLGIGIARLVPGVRPYATLISGAAEVDLRDFLLGALPALLLWEAAWIAAGMLVGLPLAHIFGRFEKVALRGGVLIALAVVALFAVREESDDRRGALTNLAPRLKAMLALLTDTGIVVSVTGGFFVLARRLLDFRPDAWVQGLVVAVALLILLVAGRTIQTPGETLFDTHYWHRLTATAGKKPHSTEAHKEEA